MGANGQAIRAGRAFVELFADDNALYRALDRAKQRVQAFAGVVGGIGARMGAAGGAIAAPLGKALFDAAGRGRDVKALADRFGLTTESVSALGYAFDTVQVPFEEFSGVMDGLAARVKGAADANSELVQGLRGLNGRVLIGKGLDEQLDMIVEKFGTIRNPVDQATVAQELFGGAGLRLLPILKQGAAGLARLKEEARGAGAIVSREEAEQSAAAMKVLNAVWREVGNTVRAVGMALLPTTSTTKDLTDRIRDGFAAARQWVEEYKGVIRIVAKLAAGVVGAGAALVGFRVAASALAPVFTLVKVGIGLAGSALGLLLSPIGAVGLAIGGLGAPWLTLTEKGRATAAALGAAFRSVAETFATAWGGVTDAVKAGNMELAFRIAGEGIKAVWFEMLSAMSRAFATFVRDNHDRIIALGAVLGAIKGGAVGGRFGPWGLLVGGVGGGAAGGLAGDRLAKMLEGFADTPELDARAAAAKGMVAKLAGEARAGLKARGEPVGDEEAERVRKQMAEYAARASDVLRVGSSQKGVFSGPISQQLGYGDQAAKRQLDATNNVRKAVDGVKAAVGLVNGNIQGVLDLVKFK